MTSKLISFRRRVRRSVPSRGPLIDYLAGLRRTPKKLPSKLFYDEEGNRLFERICALDEYYLTRAELSILRANVEEIAGLAGAQTILVELGSGAPDKASLLLSHLCDPAAYVPVEIFGEQLLRSCQTIQAEHPALRIHPLCADYTGDFRLPRTDVESSKILFYFSGSSLGNFEPIEALAFLLRLAEIGGSGAELLIGIDLKKDPEILEAAYNDRTGVTAAFNLNILARANREFAADFDLNKFRHHAFYEPLHGRITMQLESLQNQEARLVRERLFFEKGERITTEYSYKYTAGEFRALARLAGFSPRVAWTDPDETFSLHYLTAG